MQGREAELELIDAVLRRGREGHGAVILVEGEPGMGKSLLLGQAARTAAAQGYTTVAAVADEFARPIPLCPLLLALNDDAEPANDESADEDLNRIVGPDPRMRVVGQVWHRLTDLVTRGPVLVTVDDLQHSDPVTLLALRVLPRRFAASPLSWILARSVEGLARPAEGEAEAERLFDLLHRDGAHRLLLHPLPEAAIAGLVGELLGAPPGESLLALARSDGGNPLLIRELVDGLIEEKMLLTADGHVAAVAGRIPRRVRTLIQHRIEAAAPQTQRLVKVAAVLGQSFAADDIAEMLGQPASAVLPAIDEALASRIFVVDGERLSFRDSMTWRAVTEGIPDSLSRALHRQFGQLLLDRGDPVQAATHLARGARQGDGKALGELDSVARQVLPSSPRTAAELAVRALELTGREDAMHQDRSVAAVRALTAARRLREAAKVIDMSLAGPLPASARILLRGARVAVLSLSGQPGRLRAEAEALLAEPDLPPRVRDETTVALLRALGELPDQAGADEFAIAEIRGAGQGSDAVPAAARALRATVRWNQGHIAAGLRLFREATAVPSHEPGRGHPPFRLLLDFAARLIDVREYAEATALLGVECEDDDPASLAAAQAGPALLRARMHLAAGRMSSAAAEAEAVLDVDQSPCCPIAQGMLGMMALRRGDLDAASQWLDRLTAHLPEAGTGRAGVLCRIAAARLAEPRDGAAEAMRIARDLYDYVGEFRWPLVCDPAVPAWLVRLALAAGDGRLAARVAGISDELGRVNPAFPVVTAACAHARGLLDDDPGLLRLAAEGQPDIWAAASAAEDLAVLLVGADHLPAAIERLERAYENFQRAGANRDAARVRGRLRGLGVRRQHWRSADRPASGLGSLTDTERSIAALVCQGLTNRQIADRTSISANTVAFHLRKIYRKLGVASRVQLARALPGHG